MKALVLYRPDSEHARTVEEFIDTFKRNSGEEIERVDMDSPDGITQAELYDIMQFPAVLVTKDDGALVKHWVGEPLPLVNDVVGHLA